MVLSESLADRVQGHEASHAFITTNLTVLILIIHMGVGCNEIRHSSMMYASSLDQREVDHRVHKAVYNQDLIHTHTHTHTQ